MELSWTLKACIECLGTFVLVLMGDGVVACVCLVKSKGYGAGWITITWAWGLAVMCGVLVSGPYTGAHLNPAVSIGLAVAGKFAWAGVVPYIIGQMVGGFLGGVATYIFYRDHFNETEDADAKLAVFCTAPAIRNYSNNLICEIMGTFILVTVILLLSEANNVPQAGLGAVGAVPVTLLIVAIGMSLGGTTGYAINPARDLSPRIAHAVLPIKGKRDSDWAYSWVPVAGPIAGCLIAGFAFNIVKAML